MPDRMTSRLAQKLYARGERRASARPPADSEIRKVLDELHAHRRRADIAEAEIEIRDARITQLTGENRALRVIVQNQERRLQLSKSIEKRPQSRERVEGGRQWS